MGRRGPPPKPTALRVLAGNPSGKALNKSEPVPPAGAPRAPRHLGPAARSLWRELAPMLETMRVLTLADRRALEILCDAYQEWRTARAYVAKHGSTFERVTESGGTAVFLRPEVRIASDAWRRLRLALTDFGLNPSARSRVHTVGGGEVKAPVPVADPKAERYFRGA